MRKAVQIKTTGEVVILDLDAPEGSYQVLSKGVGGYIECVAFPKFDMYGNEEAKIVNPPLPYNLPATALFVATFGNVDRICGDVVFVGSPDDEGDSTGLSDADETFLRTLAKRFAPDPLTQQ